MKTINAPETQATKFLRQQKVTFTDHLYAYEEHGGTAVSARSPNFWTKVINRTGNQKEAPLKRYR